MQNSVIEELIRTHHQTLELCRSLLASSDKGKAPTQDVIARIGDEASCKFSSIFNAGNLHFEGAIAAEVIPVLHATFHSLAALILTQVKAGAESCEIGSYMTALTNVSNELFALLHVARVQPE